MSRPIDLASCSTAAGCRFDWLSNSATSISQNLVLLVRGDRRARGFLRVLMTAEREILVYEANLPIVTLEQVVQHRPRGGAVRAFEVGEFHDQYWRASWALGGRILQIDILDRVRRKAVAVGGFDLSARAPAPYLLEQEIHCRQALLTVSIFFHALGQAHRLIRARREQVRDVPRPVGLFATGQLRRIDPGQRSRPSPRCARGPLPSLLRRASDRWSIEN